MNIINEVDKISADGGSFGSNYYFVLRAENLVINFIQSGNGDMYLTIFNRSDSLDIMLSSEHINPNMLSCFDLLFDYLQNMEVRLGDYDCKVNENEICLKSDEWNENEEFNLLHMKKVENGYILSYNPIKKRKFTLGFNTNRGHSVPTSLAILKLLTNMNNAYIGIDLEDHNSYTKTR